MQVIAGGTQETVGEHPHPARSRTGSAWRWAVVVPLWLAVIALGRLALLPLVFALLGFFLLRGPVRRLAQWHLPPALGAALVLTLLVACIGVAAVELAEPAREWLDNAPTALRSVERELRDLRRPLEQVDAAAGQVQELTGGSKEVALPASKPFSSRLISGVGVTVGGLGATLVLLYLCLVYGDLLMDRLAIALVGRRSEGLIDGIGLSLSIYLATITAINLGLGLVVGLAMWGLGMPNPALWGTFAAIANFVPYLGAAVGVVAVGLTAVMTFDGSGAILLPPLVYLALTAIEGNLVTPLILGSRFRVNPVVVFLWLGLWSWLWGIAGALLAMPLLTAFKLVCERTPRLAPLGRALER